MIVNNLTSSDPTANCARIRLRQLRRFWEGNCHIVWRILPCLFDDAGYRLASGQISKLVAALRGAGLRNLFDKARNEGHLAAACSGPR